MGCAYTGSGGGPMRTEMPTATCPNEAAENVTTRMLNKAQRTMDFFIRWPFLEFVQGRTDSLALRLSLCRKTLRMASLRSSPINPELTGMLRRQKVASEGLTARPRPLPGAEGLKPTVSRAGILQDGSRTTVEKSLTPT